MNDLELELLLSPIKKLSHYLRKSKCVETREKALIKMHQLTGLNLDWQSMSHNEILNKMAECLGYQKNKEKTAWCNYRNELYQKCNKLNSAYQPFNLYHPDWWHSEDMPSNRWYFYLCKEKNLNLNFKNSKKLMEKYLSVRKDSDYKFSRCKINNVVFFKIDFSDQGLIREELKDIANTSINKDKHQTNNIHTEPSVDGIFHNLDFDYAYFKHKRNKRFFKGNMSWVYLYDSKFLYCKFWGNDFRNAICHNVDFRYCAFSSEDSKGDIMGADFSFCDCREAVFSHSYSRQSIFYKTNATEAMFNNMEVIGTLFIESSLKKACFAEARLYNVSFRNSDLRGADFQGARIEHVDCRGADLRETKGLDVSLVRIDESTLL